MTGDIPLPGVGRESKLPREFDRGPHGTREWHPEEDPWKRHEERQKRPGCRRFFPGGGKKQTRQQ